MKLPEELQFIANARMVQKTTDARMDGHLCIITGATSGVGYHAARRLAQGGANLVLVCRNREKAVSVRQELAGHYRELLDLYREEMERRGLDSDLGGLARWVPSMLSAFCTRG